MLHLSDRLNDFLNTRILNDSGAQRPQISQYLSLYRMSKPTIKFSQKSVSHKFLKSKM